MKGNGEGPLVGAAALAAALLHCPCRGLANARYGYKGSRG